MRRPNLPPGGWAFQYENPHYPDVDDTAVVGMLLHRNGDPAHAAAIARARDWIIGMQSSDGGWGAFEPENTHLYLNHIPFADHGALLDPPTADVTARCVSFLAQIGMVADAPVLARAVAWLASVQREDGGWGEDEESYGEAPHGRYRTSTASQTAWAVLGLMAAGATDHPAVVRGIDYLMAMQREDGEWTEWPYTAVGFPRVFYLRYHGYRRYFPAMALARYRNLRRGNAKHVTLGF